MKIKVPYYYKDFKCIASECPDTCCAGWEIVIDEDTYDKYKKVDTDFGNSLHSDIIKYEDGEPGFRLKNNNCAFLNKNLLCDIYSNLGEDYLCHTCKTFPRIIEEYGNLREITLSLSCPEAARLILKDNKKLDFEVTENDEFVTSYNSISADLYIQILGARQVAFNIIQKTNFNLNTRISILLMFAKEIQENIDECEISKITEIRKKYSDKTFLEDLALSLDKFKENTEKKYSLINEYFNVFNGLEKINENWNKTIHYAIDILFNKNDSNFYKNSINRFDDYYKNNQYEFKNLFTYFIFRYFMKSLYDADLLSKIKLSILSLVAIKVLDVVRFIDNSFNFTLADAIDISHMYSKDIEHSEENIEKLYTIFNEDENFNVNNLLTILK
ncbi:lysine-N-methylase [Clostridium sp. DSM 8431]|uniref:flagellin lysine-N-methylase n=1 Tax=Clostridium sp. DSM 8431 TaxID=1761781 RepID=UPI0008F2C9BC|nr:flagellin lysine-N-methylase [Clostridium sp. DSM 8431]SFU62949.1 lysine-N-methylase [Clostridium sp. DSM 8431]